MTSCHAILFFIKAELFISMNQVGDDSFANLAAYQQLIRKLIYLIFKTRSNISFVVSLLSQYNSDPRVGHFRVAKQLLCYLKGTIYLRIVWGADFTQHHGKYGPIEIVDYANKSYVRDLKDRKSITGYCFFLDGTVVIWCNRQQKIVSTLTLKLSMLL